MKQNKKLIIGFTGVKAAGKSTAFSFIKDKYPVVEEVALASKLKDACAKAFNISRSSFDDPSLKEKELEVPIYLDDTNLPVLLQEFNLTYNYDQHIRPHIGTVLHTPRKVAQYVGTEILREFDPNIHCVNAVKSASDKQIMIITDIRFPNELEFFRNMEDSIFYGVYIANYKAEMVSKKDNHASEKYILQIAKELTKIDNNSSLQDFKKAVILQFEKILSLYFKPSSKHGSKLDKKK